MIPLDLVACMLSKEQRMLSVQTYVYLDWNINTRILKSCDEPYLCDGPLDCAEYCRSFNIRVIICCQHTGIKKQGKRFDSRSNWGAYKHIQPYHYFVVPTILLMDTICAKQSRPTLTQVAKATSMIAYRGRWDLHRCYSISWMCKNFNAAVAVTQALTLCMGVWVK